MSEKPSISAEIDALLREERAFPPSQAFRAQANVRDERVYEEAERDPEGFWEGFARELEWSQPWTKVLEWNPPHAKWFVGGKINASVNCLDRHLNGPRRNKAALIWEGEPGDRRTLTYHDLHREVCQFANVLKSLGIKRGDRVAYLSAARFRSSPSRCWPARASAPCIPWCSAASLPSRCATA